MSTDQFGRYQVKSEIGHGGMATVFLAHDPRFGRDVALKVMSRALRDDPTFRGRFEREARTVATLEHPAIVPVYDFGEDNEQLYLVMRYMPGGTLSERIQRGPMTLSDIVPIYQRVSSALDHAHHEGVIHRDLKPGNILFDQYNNAFLSDFGIVKIAQESADLTGSGVIGTPAYMSPEQVHGDTKLDGRSDIYTLGIILFECLTGRKPYRADTPVKQMMAHVLNPVPSILEVKPELPSACEDVIRRSLSKERDGRFKTATEMSEALTITLTGIQPPIPVDDRPERDEAETEDLATATLDLPTLTSEKPKQPGAKQPPTAQFNVSPPDPRTQTATKVGSAALSFSGTAVEPPVAARKEAAVPQKSKTWLWLGLALVVLMLLVGSAAVFSSLFDTEPEPTLEPAVVVVENDTVTPTLPAPPPTNTPQPTDEEPSTPTPTVRSVEPRTFQFGESALGTPLTATQFGDGENTLLFVGGLHAGFSPGSVELAEALITYFRENNNEIPEALSLIVVPNLNPDSAQTPGQLPGRLNGNLVDLNRNWDCRWLQDPPWGGTPQPGLGGEAPFSEPEVQAFVGLMQDHPVSAVVFWQARAALGLSSPGACAEDSETSRPLAQVYGTAADYRIADFEELVDQVVNGDATNWLDSQGIPAISVLLPDYDEADFENNLEAVTAVMTWAADE